jgi:hypothetical protein
MLCPQCGDKLPLEARFCNEYRHSISKIGKSSAVDHSEPQSYTPKFPVDGILIERNSIEGGE